MNPIEVLIIIIPAMCISGFPFLLLLIEVFPANDANREISIAWLVSACGTAMLLLAFVTVAKFNFSIIGLIVYLDIFTLCCMRLQYLGMKKCYYRINVNDTNR